MAPLRASDGFDYIKMRFTLQQLKSLPFQQVSTRTVPF
jgi:hypothetical protein